MSLSTNPTPDLVKHRLQVLAGIANNLRNIYIANIKAYCTKATIKNAAMMNLPADEAFMRLVEEQASIKEEQVDGFRGCIWGAWKDGSNTNFLDARLGEVFMRMAVHYYAVNKALMVHTNLTDLRVPE